MASNVNGDHYSNLSRKELQSLCKRHGLPANRSKSHLASSLAHYLECPMPLKDSAARTFSKNSSFREDDGAKNVSINGIGTSKANVSPAKEDYCSLPITSKEAPHLEFHKWDNGGINLVVDLKASRSDWLKMFRDECAKPMCGSIPRSPRKDLGCLDENDKERENSSSHIIDDDELNDKLTGYNQQHQDDKNLVSALKEPYGAASTAVPPLGSIGIKHSSGAENGGLVHLKEHNLDCNGNTIPAIVEERGAGKYEGKESSKFSHFHNSVDRVSSRCLESEKVPDRKRKGLHPAFLGANDNPAPRIDAVYQRRTSRFKPKGFLQQ